VAWRGWYGRTKDVEDGAFPRIAPLGAEEHVGDQFLVVFLLLVIGAGEPVGRGRGEVGDGQDARGLIAAHFLLLELGLKVGSVDARGGVVFGRGGGGGCRRDGGSRGAGEATKGAIVKHPPIGPV